SKSPAKMRPPQKRPEKNPRRWNEPIRIDEAQARRTRHDLFLIFQKVLPYIEQPVRTRAGTLLLVPRVPCRSLVVLRRTLRRPLVLDSPCGCVFATGASTCCCDWAK